MLCLGIDTTGANCSAAIVDSAKIHAYASETIHRGHAEKLAPMVESLFAKAGINANQLDHISVCVGPGSFTGLRVGLSLAKGLALPWNIPVVGVSGLEVWARTADPEGEKTIATLADVRRGDIFSQIWRNGLADNPPRLNPAESTMSSLSKKMAAVGSAIDGSNDFICPALTAWIGMNYSPVTHPAEPLYHRPPDAKLPGGLSL